jgi:hypothetical protein
MPSFDAFYDSLIREQDKLLHLGFISIVGTSKEALVAQQKQGPKHPKKQYPSNNKQNKSPKPSQPTRTPNGTKSKGKKIERHCNFCG